MSGCDPDMRQGVLNKQQPALIMALDRAIRNGDDEASESVYDERGLFVL